MRVNVSLLVCNLRPYPAHAKATEFALRSLLESDITIHDWALQIVDNGSTCNTTHNLLNQISNQNVKVFKSDVNLGIGGGRNKAYHLLQEWHPGDVIIDIHTDHVFPAVWATPLLEHLEDPGGRPPSPPIGILGASLVTGGGEWRTPKLMCTYDKSYTEFMNTLETAARCWRRPGYMAPGLTHPCAIRQTMIEDLNARDDKGRLCIYDPRMPGLQNFEDMELCYRAEQGGWGVWIDYESVVYHHYHFSRLTGELNAVHGMGYNSNNLYCQAKHGPDFIRYIGEMGQMLERANVR